MEGISRSFPRQLFRSHLPNRKSVGVCKPQVKGHDSNLICNQIYKVVVLCPDVCVKSCGLSSKVQRRTKGGYQVLSHCCEDLRLFRALEKSKTSKDNLGAREVFS